MVRLSTQTSSKRGSSEREVTALAVMPRTSSPCAMVIIVTPVAKHPMRRRYSSFVNAICMPFLRGRPFVEAEGCLRRGPAAVAKSCTRLLLQRKYRDLWSSPLRGEHTIYTASRNSSHRKQREPCALMDPCEQTHGGTAPSMINECRGVPARQDTPARERRRPHVSDRRTPWAQRSP